MAYELSQYQKDVLATASDMGTSFYINAVAGSGKCLLAGTEVLLFNGDVIAVEEVRVGMELMGPDSRPRKVLSTHFSFGKMRTIVPVKGEPFTCTANHVMTLAGTNRFIGQLIDIPLNQYEARIKSERSFARNWKLIRTGVNFPTAEKLPYPAWLVGVWIADGILGEARIAKPDIEIELEIRRISKEIGQLSSIAYPKDRCPVITILSNNGPNRFRQFVRTILERDGEKTIPHQYLTASYEDRMELLAGIIDGDGYVYDSIELTTVSHKLAKQYLFLARSLGFAAYQSIKMVRLAGWSEARPYHRISISGDLSLIPCRMLRKQSTGRQQIKRVNVTGFSIEDHENDWYYGFELDGDGRFLLGDFTITHNTSTLVEIAQRSGLRSQFLFVAFSKLIATELAKRLPDNECKTLHAMAYGVLRRNRPLVHKWYDPDTRKYMNIAKSMLDQYKRHISPPEYINTLRQIDDEEEHQVGLWKLNEIASKMMVTMTPPVWDAIEEMADTYNLSLPCDSFALAELMEEMLLRGRELAFNNGMINFDEMLYYPVMERWAVGNYHTVAVDESQDLNSVQQEFLTLIRKQRVVAVGDEFQSIFAFAGALPNSTSDLIRKFNLKTLPLSVCYRCGTDIVEWAQHLVPHIEPFSGNEKGIVREIYKAELVKNLTDGCFIVCRLNAPLVSLCLKLLLEGVAAKIRGRDIADQLIKTIKQIQAHKGFSMENFEYWLDDYYERELRKIFQRGGRRKKVLEVMLQDRVECIRQFYDKTGAMTVDEIINGIQRLFVDNQYSQVTLMSGHKSKGLESSQVFVIEPDKLPLIVPNQTDIEIQQERNLDYVVRTRAKKELVYVV